MSIEDRAQITSRAPLWRLCPISGIFVQEEKIPVPEQQRDLINTYFTRCTGGRECYSIREHDVLEALEL